jgi:hypothetical protein
VFGCYGLGIGRPMAIKTGTSEPYANSFSIGDTWAIGYTPQLVVGSWFGNADNSPMTDISSTSVSWRAVRDFMIEYHQDLPVEPFMRPEGLVEASVCVPSWLKPDDGCPITSPEDLFVESSLSEEEDDWWTMASIDTRTGKLAGELTPPEYVEDRYFLQLPESLPDFDRDEALSWAFVVRGSLGEPPTEQTEESDIPIVIDSPLDGDQVQGVIAISGRALSEDFESFRLEYGPEAEPEEWTLISESDSPIADGVLGTWDASALPPGVYTIRLVLVDETLGEIIARVLVEVLSDTGPTPTAAPFPTATPFGNGG